MVSNLLQHSTGKEDGVETSTISNESKINFIMLVSLRNCYLLTLFFSNYCCSVFTVI